MEETYIYRQQKKLRCGYTTGTCATAAATAAASMLLNGQMIGEVSVLTPKGIRFLLPIEEIDRSPDRVSCGVRKDGGDDPDVTTGMLICALVGRDVPSQKPAGNWYDYEKDGVRLHISGGEGIGLVTKPGLACEPGYCAINPVPRSMIFAHVLEVCQKAKFQGNLWIVLFAPEGVTRAEKTFNANLGILGGISILGTTGVVEPMSEDALLATIRLEIRQRKQEGREILLMTPGNYGETFLEEAMDLSLAGSVKCSNYLGAAIDMAVEEGFSKLLFVGHAGKLVKAAAGIMNTHSSMADGRMEIIGAHAAACGAGQETVREILQAVTVDQALAVLEAVDLREMVMERVMERILWHLRRRAGKDFTLECVMFTNERGILGESAGARAFAKELRTDRDRRRN